MRRNFQLAGSLGLAVLLASAALLFEVREAKAADLSWKGFTWNVTNGGMAGVANGSPANVSVDADGYLHLKIQKNGTTWTAAELFTTTKLGFGTYQWQIDGPIDTIDKNVVLGLFPYGPAAGIGGDGTNEIDIEYSRWGQANGPNGDWTNYPASGSTIGEFTYTFSLNGGTLSTSRFIWTKSSIEDFLLEGLQPVKSTAQLLKTWKYAPQNPTTNIPQQALPLGINLWCFDIPSDGKNVEIVIRDFQFVAEGTDSGGGTGGTTGGGGSPSGGSANARGGSTSTGGVSARGGSTSTGGVSARGGSTSTGGVSAWGGTPSGGGAVALGGRSNGGMTSSGGASSGGARAAGGSFGAAGVTSTGGMPSNGGNSASGGAVSANGGVTSAGGLASNPGGTSGGARSNGGAATSSGGAASGGAAPWHGGTTGNSTAGRLDIDPEEPAGCSIRGSKGSGYGAGLGWICALPLLLSRKLGRRARR